MALTQTIVVDEINDISYMYDAFIVNGTNAYNITSDSMYWTASSYETVINGSTQSIILSSHYVSNLAPRLTPMLHNQSLGTYTCALPTFSVSSISVNLSGYDGSGTLFYVEPSRRPTIRFYIPSVGANFAEVTTDITTNQLSGYVYTPTTSYSISGTVDQTTRNTFIDLTQLPTTGFFMGSAYTSRPPGQLFASSGTFIPLTAISVYATYRIDAGSYTWNTPITHGISGASLFVSALNYDYDFALSSVDTTNSTVGRTYLYPKTTNVNVLNSFITFADLKVNRTDTQTWDLSSLNEQTVLWTASQPICATTLRPPYTSFSINTTRSLPVSDGYDVLRFYSDAPTNIGYTISGYLPATINRPTYTFNYDPLCAESLNVDLVSAADFSIWLQLKRLVIGYANEYNGTYPLSANTPIRWNISPTVTNTKMYSGLSGQDVFYPYPIDQIQNTLNITKYPNNHVYTPVVSAYSGLISSIPLTGWLVYPVGLTPGISAITGYNNTIGLDIVQVNFDPNTVTSYTISGILGDYSKYDTYTFVPNFSTTSLYVSTMSIDLQPYVKTINLKALNQYLPGFYTHLNTRDTIVWDARSNDDISLNSSMNATYPDGTPYTFGQIVDSSNASNMLFTLTANKSDALSLCSFSILVSAITGAGLPLTHDYSFSFYEYPLDSDFDMTFKINNEYPPDVNSNMWRLTGSYGVTATDLSTYTALQTISCDPINWTVKGPIATDDFTSICMSSDGKYQSATQDNSTSLITSKDYGVTWTFTSINALCTWSSNCMSSNGQYRLAVSDNGNSANSSDYGVTWVIRGGFAPNTEGQYSWYSCSMSKDGRYQLVTGRLGDFRRIFISSNYGVSWTQIDHTIFNVIDVGGYGVIRNSSISSDGRYQTVTVNWIYFSGSYPTAIYTSEDYGVTWTWRITIGSNLMSYGYGEDVVMSSTGQYQTVLIYVPGTTVGIYRYSTSIIYTSNDFGHTWTGHGFNAYEPEISANVAARVVFMGAGMTGDGQHQYVSSFNRAFHWADPDTAGLIYKSDDYGNTWSTGTPATTSFWRDVAVSDDNTHITGIGSARIYNCWKNIHTNATRVWNWGDGTSTASGLSTATHIYNETSYKRDTVTMSISNVMLDTTKGPYAIQSPQQMTINFVEQFLSGGFIVYPTIVFPTSSTDDADVYKLDNSNYTLSQGVCAYGEGHIETFHLSASIPSTITVDGKIYDTTYRWTLGTSTPFIAGRTTSITVPSDTGTYNAAGTSIALDMFNDIFPINTMLPTHIADNGYVEIYPNFGMGLNSYAYTQSTNTDKLFQTIRMVSYEAPSAVITNKNDVLFIPVSSDINATANISWPNYSPVTIDNASPNLFVWTLSTATWYSPLFIYSSTPDISYTLNIGDGLVPGTVKRNQLTPVSISISGNIYGTIDYNPNDWESVYTNLSQSTYTHLLSVFTQPTVTYFVDRQIVLTGELVKFENTTPQTPTNLLTGFIWDGGNGVVSTISGFAPFYNTYYSEGVYDLSISAIAFNGSIFVTNYPNAITVLNNYQPRDIDIFRIYQTTELQLPYTLEQVSIPPNEWVVADNINAAFQKLLDNQTYLTNACKLYNPPPGGYYGWLGTKIEDDPTSPLYGTSVFKWRTTSYNVSAAEHTELIINDPTHFTNVKDIVAKNNWLYIANNGTLEIRADDNNATLIDSRSYKGIGDLFIRLDSVQVDSRDRIYVLDSPKNRIVVFGYDYYATNKWTILYSWGGLGGATAKTKFQNPTQMLVDSSDDVWICDSGNGVIKNYSSTGSWKNTISSTLFNNKDNKPLSMTIDSDNNLHVMDSTGNIIKMNKNGTFITTYKYQTIDGSLPIRIIAANDAGFLYAIQSNCVCKLRNSGQNAGLFAEIMGGANYKGGYQDSNKNLLLANNNSIIKFNDRLQILNTIRDNSANMWSVSNIMIDKDEYVSDMVYNRCLSRIHDNLTILNRSIRGKIIVITTSTGESLISTRGYTPNEYKFATNIVPKTDVLIGTNELVTADVINRCISQLYSIQAHTLKLLS